MEEKVKIVEFDKYCEKCKFFNTPDSMDPCDTCLGNPVNENSHKPVNFKEEK